MQTSAAVNAAILGNKCGVIVVFLLIKRDWNDSNRGTVPVEPQLRKNPKAPVLI
jgi:hypothetical protein